MRRIKITSRSRWWAMAVAVCCLAAACGSEPGATTTTTQASGLPQEVVGDGVLQVATSGAFPPMNYMADDGETVIGVSVDLIEAMAAELDLEVEMVVTDFAGILTGIDSGRFDAGVIFADTAERQAIVDILDVMRTGHRFLVAADYEGPDTPPCGSTVALAAGSNEVRVLEELSEELCTSKGDPAFEGAEYPSNDNAALALSSERAEYFLTSAESAAFRVKEQPDTFKAIGDVQHPALTGFAFSKNHPDLTRAMADAFRSVVASGKYAEILETWELSEVAIEDPYINTQPIAD